MFASMAPLSALMSSISIDTSFSLASCSAASSAAAASGDWASMKLSNATNWLKT